MNFHQLISRLTQKPKPGNMVIPIKVRVKGEYRIRKLDGATREVIEETPWFDNLITDIGLDRMGSQQAFMTYCRIGTGTAAAANTDTQLQSQSASTLTTVGGPSASNAGASTYATTSVNVYEFALGAVVGNMAEVGVGWTASTASTLFSRARINDAGGSPTTITVLVTEILQVSYRFTIYPQVADVAGNVTISGVVYAFTSRGYNVAQLLTYAQGTTFFSNIISPTASSAGLQALTATAAGGSVASLATGVIGGYTAGTRYVDYTVSASISQGNVPGGLGIRTIFTGLTSSYVQIEFVPNIPKDSTKVFSLTLRMSWNRH